MSAVLSKVLSRILGGNSVLSLQKESQDAMSIFEKTVSRLEKINDKIHDLISRKTDEIHDLEKQVIAKQLEIDALDATGNKNDRLTDKLMSFLED